MLRLHRRGSESKFEYRHVDRSQVPALVAAFLQQWGKEFATPGDALDSRTADPANRRQAQAATRPIPRSEFVAEWQDGNGVWDEAAPTEVIPIT
jgi:hypothetical protein